MKSPIDKENSDNKPNYTCWECGEVGADMVQAYSYPGGIYKFKPVHQKCLKWYQRWFPKIFPNKPLPTKYRYDT